MIGASKAMQWVKVPAALADDLRQKQTGVKS